MRRLFPIALILLTGCGKGKLSASTDMPPPPATAGDLVTVQREKDAQGAFSLDAANAAIEEALAAAKALAPRAGGEAKDVLLDVADMLDSAGATLADHDDPPPPLDEYRKSEKARNDARAKALADALDALHELRDASGTLDDLAQNAPSAHAKALEGIRASVDEAIASIEEAIERFGGKVPPEEDSADA